MAEVELDAGQICRLVSLGVFVRFPFLTSPYLELRGRPMLRRDYLARVARNGGCRTKAVCALARKLVPLLLAVMQSGQPFDRQRWQAQRHALPEASSRT